MAKNGPFWTPKFGSIRGFCFGTFGISHYPCVGHFFKKCSKMSYATNFGIKTTFSGGYVLTTISWIFVIALKWSKRHMKVWEPWGRFGIPAKRGSKNGRKTTKTMGLEHFFRNFKTQKSGFLTTFDIWPLFGPFLEPLYLSNSPLKCVPFGQKGVQKGVQNMTSFFDPFFHPYAESTEKVPF